MGEQFEAHGDIWIWKSDKAPASWHFMTIKGETANAIRLSALMIQGKRRGWGSVRVTARIGNSQWQTSLFPDKAGGGWLLPLKAAIRHAEGLVAGDKVDVVILL